MKKLVDWIKKQSCLMAPLALALLLLLGQLACFIQQGEVMSTLSPLSTLSPVITPRPAEPRVMRVRPSDGSQDVKTDDTITVLFDRPMVDLTAKNHSVPIDIQPAAEGSGNSRWIAEDVYRFTPRGLAPATHYTVTVPAGITSLAGGKLREDYVVTFSTTRPVTKSTTPEADAESVDPGSVVQITFNQSMDRESVESRFKLVDVQGWPVKGKFYWGKNGRIMTFNPQDNLERSVVYRAELAAGALAEGKKIGTAEAHAWQFTVAGPPQIVSSSPADGDLNAHYRELELQFNVPMNTRSVEKALRITPEPEYVDLRWNKNNTRLVAYVDFDPSAVYSVLLDEGIKDRYDVPLSGNRSIVFRSAPFSPMLSLYGPHESYRGAVGSYVADQAVEQYVGMLNLDVITFSLSSVEPMDFVAGYHDNYWMPDLDAVTYTPVHTWTHSPDLPLNKVRYKPIIVTDADGDLPAGIYLLEARAEGLYDARFMVVSRANLALKWGPRQVFVWATDVVSGTVIPDMHVAVHKKGGKLLAEGTTDADGVFMAQVDDLGEAYWDRSEEILFAVGEGPQGLALCVSEWDQGITAHDFDLPQGDAAEDRAAVYIYTDRPIYRPGQTVYFKGIVRADNDGRYVLLDAEHGSIPVSINDSRGNELFSGDLPLSEFGTINGEFKLSETALLGRYALQADLPGGGEPQRLTFTVSEYRRPEFKVEVSAETASADYAVHGETITVTVQADYYFGQPMPDAPVRWTVRGSPYRFSLPGQEEYDFGPYTNRWWYYGEERDHEGSMTLTSGKGRTDENGRFVINVPVNLDDSKVSQVLFIEAVLADDSDQQVAGSTVVVAHKTDTYLGVQPRRYVGGPGNPFHVQLIALDPHRKPKGDVPVTVEFYNLHRDTVREKTDSGGYVWRNTLTEELVATQVVTTSNVDGRALFTVTPPEGGEYKIAVHMVDGLGNESESSTHVWAWREGYVNWGINNHNRIQLIPDKREYEPGDVAEVLVAAPFTGCLALITFERDGVLSYDVQRLDGTGALLKVPILADYAPNAFVSVSLLKAQGDGFSVPAFKLGYVELRVVPRAQQLDVAITPDRERYLPGETVTYNIRVTDYLGKPVTAELSVGVVNAAVLALLDDNAEPILDAFYHTRRLKVWNAQTLVTSVERLNEELLEKGKGGGGGRNIESVRRFFRDTAYWSPTVVTGWDGRAVVQVPLPDDLTTWRLRAKGVTLDTRVGDGSVDVISTKDLLVRPVLPRFFTVGDEATVAALVHNYTPLTQTVQVEMQTTGLEVEGDKAASTVVIGPGDAEKVAWQVSVPKVREVKVLFSAQAMTAPARDAVEITLPVHAYAEMVVIAANESVPLDEGDGERLTVTVELPDDTDEMDELIIETAPSMGAGIRTGLEYLTGYPYG